jgi:hypothetical protein
MAKKPKIKEPRVLTCAISGKSFTYSGVGRPPKYHPDFVDGVRARQRKDAQKRSRQNKRAKREQDVSAALSA